ncbi:cytochrome P450 2A13-like [Gastrophryne carolinensis]
MRTLPGAGNRKEQRLKEVKPQVRTIEKRWMDKAKEQLQGCFEATDCEVFKSPNSAKTRSSWSEPLNSLVNLTSLGSPKNFRIFPEEEDLPIRQHPVQEPKELPFEKHQESKQPGTEFYDKNVLYSVLQLIFAGTVTVSATIRHGLLILVCYPEIQDKVYEEIKNVIGDSRNPNIGDRSKLPYTDAVVHEIQRFSDVVPLNLTHAAIKDVKFQGYTIPKGTDVYPLLYCTLRDPAYFKTPDKFNPEHFLDENGAFKTEDAFIPFSAGKRICVGEGLAKTELFLFLTTILQNFKLTSKRSFTDADIGPRMAGFSNVPAEYEISFVPR